MPELEEAFADYDLGAGNESDEEGEDADLSKRSDRVS